MPTISYVEIAVFLLNEYVCIYLSVLSCCYFYSQCLTKVIKILN